MYNMNYILSINVVIMLNILLNNYYIYYKTLIPIYTLILKQIFNLDVVILNTTHELTPRSAGWWLTQKSYKN